VSHGLQGCNSPTKSRNFISVVNGKGSKPVLQRDFIDQIHRQKGRLLLYLTYAFERVYGLGKAVAVKYTDGGGRLFVFYYVFIICLLGDVCSGRKLEWKKRSVTEGGWWFTMPCCSMVRHALHCCDCYRCFESFGRWLHRRTWFDEESCVPCVACRER
jgi:hypothetical protein